MKKQLLALILSMMTLLYAGPVLADGIIIIDPPIAPPPPDWTPWLTIRYHRVTVTIADQVATTKVDQAFRNDGRMAAEGVYVFPLPPGAAAQNFVMWVDGQPIAGEILPADKAREIYEGYVRRQRDPALLEYVGRDAVRARIFPIPAGEERRIQLEYTQILPIEEGLLHYRYPLNTERFSALPLEQVSIHVSLTSQTPLRTVYSPSHQNEVMITREGAHRASVSYEANHVLPDRDFELYASATQDEIGANLLTYQTGAEDGFFLLMLTPALETEARRVLPRDILLVLDTSGSMDGEKLKQAQDALAYILRRLNPEDRFNVVAFSSGARVYAPTLQGPQEAEAAIAWVYRLEALGGTNIYLGLSAALAQPAASSDEPADGTRPTVVVFLTDGMATEGIVDDAALLSALAQETPAAVRLFPFGVGYDVNTLFLDQLAADHRGVPAYVAPQERIDEKVAAFYGRIQSPVLTNIALDFGGAHVYDVFPNPLSDLYAGTQLIVAGRYSGAGARTITLTGEVEGRRETYTYAGNFAAFDGKDFIPRLWASRKIGYLLTQIRLYGEKEEWIGAVVNLSLRYGIITPYTSFLVEEPNNILSSEGRARVTEEAAEYFHAAPLAPSGEKAVEDAVMRQELEAAAAAPTAGAMPAPDGALASASSVRYVGDKTFLCRATVCTDTAYVPDKMTPQTIIFMSEAYWELTARQPELSAYFAVAEESYFVAPDGTAYHFRLGTEADAVARPESDAPLPSPTTDTPSPTTSPATPTATTAPSTNPGMCGSAALLLSFSVGIVLRRKNRALSFSSRFPFSLRADRQIRVL